MDVEPSVAVAAPTEQPVKEEEPAPQTPIPPILTLVQVSQS